MDETMRDQLHNVRAYGYSITRGIIKLTLHGETIAAESMRAVVELDVDIWNKLKELGDMEP
jgi:hypothetical protein